MGKTKLKKIEIELESSDKNLESRDLQEPEAASEADLSSKEENSSQTKPKKTTPKKGKKLRSKKYLEKIENVERNKLYEIDQALDLVKDSSYSKFDGSLEIHINTALKNIRGLVSLPFASAKKLTVIAFGKGAEESGADIVGDEEALKEIEKGKIGFDVMVTTPDWMPKLAKAAKVLGPRGLMPNPKNGTIAHPSADGLKKAIAEIQGGKIEYKTEKDRQVIHLALGKLNQPNEELAQNIKLLLTTIGKSKLKKVTLAPTMGPGVKLNLSSL